METKTTTIKMCGGAVTIDADFKKDFRNKLKAYRKEHKDQYPASNVYEISKVDMMHFPGVISIDCTAHCFAI